MTLATHAVVGGAAAALFPSHPITAFVVGFFSHFILDAIPHWDYKILSAYANPDIAMSTNAQEAGVSERVKADQYFKLDLLRTGSDALLGLVITFFIWYPATLMQSKIIVLGAIGAMLPDFLQFIYMRLPHQPMVAIQKFHAFIHADYRLNNRPIIGVLTQIITIAVIVALAKYLIHL